MHANSNAGTVERMFLIIVFLRLGSGLIAGALKFNNAASRHKIVIFLVKCR